MNQVLMINNAFVTRTCAQQKQQQQQQIQLNMLAHQQNQQIRQIADDLTNESITDGGEDTSSNFYRVHIQTSSYETRGKGLSSISSVTRDRLMDFEEMPSITVDKDSNSNSNGAVSAPTSSVSAAAPTSVVHHIPLHPQGLQSNSLQQRRNSAIAVVQSHSNTSCSNNTSNAESKASFISSKRSGSSNVGCAGVGANGSVVRGNNSSHDGIDAPAFSYVYATTAAAVAASTITDSNNELGKEAFTTTTTIIPTAPTTGVAEQMKVLQAKVSKQESQMREMSEQYSEMKEENRALKRDIDRLQSSADARLVLDKNELQIKKLTAKNTSLQAVKEEYENRISDYQNLVDDLNQQVLERENRTEDVQRQLSIAEHLISQMRQQNAILMQTVSRNSRSTSVPADKSPAGVTSTSSAHHALLAAIDEDNFKSQKSDKQKQSQIVQRNTSIPTESSTAGGHCPQMNMSNSNPVANINNINASNTSVSQIFSDEIYLNSFDETQSSMATTTGVIRQSKQPTQVISMQQQQKMYQIQQQQQTAAVQQQFQHQMALLHSKLKSQQSNRSRSPWGDTVRFEPSHHASHLICSAEEASNINCNPDSENRTKSFDFNKTLNQKNAAAITANKLINKSASRTTHNNNNNSINSSSHQQNNNNNSSNIPLSSNSNISSSLSKRCCNSPSIDVSKMFTRSTPTPPQIPTQSIIVVPSLSNSNVIPGGLNNPSGQNVAVGASMNINLDGSLDSTNKLLKELLETSSQEFPERHPRTQHSSSSSSSVNANTTTNGRCSSELRAPLPNSKQHTQQQQQQQQQSQPTTTYHQHHHHHNLHQQKQTFETFNVSPRNQTHSESLETEQQSHLLHQLHGYRQPERVASQSVHESIHTSPSLRLTEVFDWTSSSSSSFLNPSKPKQLFQQSSSSSQKRRKSALQTSLKISGITAPSESMQIFHETMMRRKRSAASTTTASTAAAATVAPQACNSNNNSTVLNLSSGPTITNTSNNTRKSASKPRKSEGCSSSSNSNSTRKNNNNQQQLNVASIFAANMSLGLPCSVANSTKQYFNTRMTLPSSSASSQNATPKLRTSSAASSSLSSSKPTKSLTPTPIRATHTQKPNPTTFVFNMMPQAQQFNSNECHYSTNSSAIRNNSSSNQTSQPKKSNIANISTTTQQTKSAAKKKITSDIIPKHLSTNTATTTPTTTTPTSKSKNSHARSSHSNTNKSNSQIAKETIPQNSLLINSQINHNNNNINMSSSNIHEVSNGISTTSTSSTSNGNIMQQFLQSGMRSTTSSASNKSYSSHAHVSANTSNRKKKRKGTTSKSPQRRNSTATADLALQQKLPSQSASGVTAATKTLGVISSSISFYDDSLLDEQQLQHQQYDTNQVDRQQSQQHQQQLEQIESDFHQATNNQTYVDMINYLENHSFVDVENLKQSKKSPLDMGRLSNLNNAHLRSRSEQAKSKNIPVKTLQPNVNSMLLQNL